MSGLLAIAPVNETVTVQGVKIHVYGVSLEGAADLLNRFPELRALFTGRDVPVADLAAKAPAAVAAIIAAGIGYPGDEEQEHAARRLPLEAQLDLLAPILKLTLPNGVSAFAEKLKALMGSVTVTDGSAASAPATNSRKRPRR
ncbi:hypothetical protein AA309_20225 [Microvirga vignae]|uniref:Tail assembly chaperone n=1 Tax=Microvirga vignae TaxID=1225564 RepID=A0A0H1R8Q0_9HYPH|nr:hypothetical protein [Microvirga vignae]KLK91424.1 hypothetical protein AA309_20225 [Microvirga vignae]